MTNYNKYRLFMKRSYANNPYDDNKRILSLYEIKQGLRMICPRYQIRVVWLFGSYAYDNPDRFSDLEFLIDYGECQGFERIGLVDELERYFRKGVEAVNIHSMSQILKDEIGKKKVLVYDKLR